MHISGRVNIYGRQEAVADWLVHQVTQIISLDCANLVVIDGIGDLVPRLKRKATVTRLLGEHLSYVDIDVCLMVHGFPWKTIDTALLGSPERIVVSNGPRVPNSTIVLTECYAHGVAALATRFLAGDDCFGENLELLRRGEGIVIAGDEIVFTTWHI